MKCIIIVDVPVYYDPSKIRAYCSLRTDRGKILLKDNYFELKPLPEKKDVVVAGKVDLISLGRNDCIDELLEKPE